MERARPNEEAVREQLRDMAAPEREPDGAPAERPDVEPKPGVEPADEVVPTRGAEPDAPQGTDVETGEPAGAETGEPAGAETGEGAERQTETGEPADPGEPPEADPGEATSDQPHSDEDPLARAERERAEYLDLAQRTRAELDNFRKRAARDSAQAGERAKANLVRELLPVLDNLERALGSASEAEQHLAEGVRMVHAQLLAALEREGIEAFHPEGEAFDPECHEALSTREDGESGLVLDVVEKGYRMNGTVLRPARVVVSA